MTLFFLTFSTSTAGHTTLSNAGARDGMAGGGLTRTPSRAAREPTHLWAGPQGGFPLLPLLVMQKERWRQLSAGHVTTSAWAPNPMAQWLLCPQVTLTDAFTPRLNPRGLPTDHLGFPQSSILQPNGEERGRRRGRSGARLRRAAPRRLRAARGAKPGPPGREPSCRGSERRAGPKDQSRGCRCFRLATYQGDYPR
jgi:hypothetical protein